MNNPNPEGFLEFLTNPPGFSQLLVAAHPDDEVIGAGARLAQWQPNRILQVTDGAPRDMKDALAAGFDDREKYAEARKRELRTALDLVGIDAWRLIHLDFTDQEASLHLLDLTLALVEYFVELQPEIVLTHPYEGGHPDHDATAFAVHSAVKILTRIGLRKPLLIEFTSYFNRNGSMATGDFLNPTSSECVRFPLNDWDRDLKRRMFECFATQKHVLQYFSLDAECFRPAPAYDFAQPPHPGRLYYELFPWGMTGEHWRQLAGAVAADLKLQPSDATQQPQPLWA